MSGAECVRVYVCACAWGFKDSRTRQDIFGYTPYIRRGCPAGLRFDICHISVRRGNKRHFCSRFLTDRASITKHTAYHHALSIVGRASSWQVSSINQRCSLHHKTPIHHMSGNHSKRQERLGQVGPCGVHAESRTTRIHNTE